MGVLVVRVELWPKGEADRKRELAVVAIANVGGDAEAGDYEFAVSHQAGGTYRASLDPHELLRNPRSAWKTGRIRGYARRYGAVRLVHWALREAFKQRGRR